MLVQILTDISAATAPAIGQILTATSPTSAIWQTSATVAPKVRAGYFTRDISIAGGNQS